VDDIQRINNALRDYPQKIYESSNIMENLRERWQLAEARKDFEEAKEYLTAKAGNLTEGQAKAKATEAIYEIAQAVIVAESSYRRALADQMRLENEFTAVRKQAELLKLTEQHIGRAA
jgi:hypothetical protein